MSQKAKEDAETEALAQASGAANGDGAGSDDAGGAADTDAPDDADDSSSRHAPGLTFSTNRRISWLYEQLHVYCIVFFSYLCSGKRAMRLVALEEHNARLGGVDVLAENV